MIMDDVGQDTVEDVVRASLRRFLTGKVLKGKNEEVTNATQADI